jgi:hypothetical protein
VIRDILTTTVRRFRTRAFTGPIALLGILASAATAQQRADSAITVVPGFAGGSYVESRAPIQLTLSRVPAAGEGRIAVFVGTADLTSLFAAEGATLAFRSNGVDLPSGETDVKVFLVRGAAWNELAKFAIRVLTPRGFEKALVDPGVELRNTGQLAEGHSGSEPAPPRSTFQAIAGTLSLETAHRRDSMSFTSSVHVLGANERRDAVRFAEKGEQAQLLDLADYALRFEGRKMVIAAGQVTAGVNRHLINGFASRGVTGVVSGSRASFSVGAENGTSIVGMDNIAGLAHSDHRIFSSGVGVELFPARPGAVHVDATVLQGALLPVSGFTQGGITSGERSSGYGVQLAASTPSQRIRIAAGMASSRSEFAADPAQSSSSSIVPSAPHRASARYAEFNAMLLQGRKLFGVVPVTLNLGVKHERVDPLYRSVAVAMQSDIERDGFDVGGMVDVVSVLVAGGGTTDNLDRIASLLTTRGRSSSVTLGAPLASLLRVTHGSAWWPTVSYDRQQMHQFGAGVPAGGAYTPSDIPDQVTVAQNAGAQWQVSHWQFAYRLSFSGQDNRQPGQELADFASRVHAFTVGVTVGSRVMLTLDVGLERQENKALSQLTTVHRAGLAGNWHITPVTTLDGNITASRTNDAGAGSNAHVSSVQLGIARGFNLWHSTDAVPRGQAFLRFTRQSNELFNLGAPLAPPTQASGHWNLASGLTLRLF